MSGDIAHNGRKRSHDRTEMPPATWSASSNLAQDCSDSPLSGEGVGGSSADSLDEHLIGSMHISTQQAGSKDQERNSELKEHILSENEPPIGMKCPDPTVPLEDMDWDDLERRYNDAMAERDKIEDDICQEFGSLFEVQPFSDL